MREILFLAHRIPFPPDRGDKIRSHHVLRHLAALAKVHVATFADDPDDAAAQADLAALAETCHVAERTRNLPLAGIEALLRGKPVSLTAFRDPGIAAYVAGVLRDRPIDAIYVFSGQMGQYVPADWQGRLVMDFVDVDSAKFEAYARKNSGAMRPIYSREARLLAKEEARLAGRADVSLLVSEDEAALFRARLGATARVAALTNGIDAELFDPAAGKPEPNLSDWARPRLIFAGQMDYPPNVAAVVRAVTRLMPRIRAVVPEASFHVVGRSPVAQVKALDGIEGCCVWGRVEDMPAFLRAADLALIPLEIARGVQNKVLEAMAMALPVVASPEAITGIGASEGREFVSGADDDALVQAVLALLRDHQRAAAMGRAARRFVVEHRSWSSVLAPLSGLLFGKACHDG